MRVSKGGGKAGGERSTWFFEAGGCIMRNGKKAREVKEGGLWT